MSERKKIKSALISVYHKDDKIKSIIGMLNSLQIKIYSTGGTQEFINSLGINATPVEDLTGYPSILNGRVKTLHPKIFGGILARSENPADIKQLEAYDIPPIDLVIVDLYPFEKTVMSTGDEAAIIEKIDIGGISLIRAAAKNYKDVLIVPSAASYDELINLLEAKKGDTDLTDRRQFAVAAFGISSHYDTAIYSYFNKNNKSEKTAQTAKILTGIHGKPAVLRYGENPHQKAEYYGNTEECFEKLNGKEISYNNLIDIDASLNIVREFTEPAIIIIKHTNACGACSRQSLKDAWQGAYSGDPVSAFGGIISANREIDSLTAEEINKIFFEVIIAPGYDKNALQLLKEKKNRIILQLKDFSPSGRQIRSLLNGIIMQDMDLTTETREDFRTVTKKTPTEKEITDMLFGNIIVKHNKSNAIVLAKDRQLIGIGTGQTSRVDATAQAIAKAKRLGFDLNGAVMASDAFFPFPDCAELACSAGINAILQPGGSIRDIETIDYCDKNNMSMIFTGNRHFKH